jgi:hypothetical protein
MSWLRRVGKAVTYVACVSCLVCLEVTIMLGVRALRVSEVSMMEG